MPPAQRIRLSFPSVCTQEWLCAHNHTCTQAHTHMCTPALPQTHVHTHTQACTHAPTPALTQTHTHKHTHRCIQVPLHTSTHTCTHTCAHTDVHTHTRARRLAATHAYQHSQTHAHSHTHSHMRRHTQMHTHVPILWPPVSRHPMPSATFLPWGSLPTPPCTGREGQGPRWTGGGGPAGALSAVKRGAIPACTRTCAHTHQAPSPHPPLRASRQRQEGRRRDLREGGG